MAGGSMQRRIIACANQKGGVAKTTSVVNIGAALSRAGKKVLLIDLDPQANLTETHCIAPDELDSLIQDVILNDVPLRDIIVEGEGAPDLAPASEDLVGAEVELVGMDDKNYRLKEAISRIRGYDYILIDCPPSLGQLTINALCAATEVMIPIQAEFFSLRGLRKLLKTIEGVRSGDNKNLKISGLFVVRYSSNKNLNQGVIDQLRDHFADKLFKTPIRENISIAEAPAAGMDIFNYRGSSHGAEDYHNLADEIIAQEKS